MLKVKKKWNATKKIQNIFHHPKHQKQKLKANKLENLFQSSVCNLISSTKCGHHKALHLLSNIWIGKSNIVYHYLAWTENKQIPQIPTLYIQLILKVKKASVKEK